MRIRQHHFELTRSTQAEVKQFLNAGEVAPFLVTAAAQNAGQGRLGRQWISPPGNFYGSLAWRAAVPPAHYGEYSFLAGVALRQTIAECWPPHPNPLPQGEREPYVSLEQNRSPAPGGRGLGGGGIISLKWPNDVLLAGRKCAGILIESENEHLIIGMGVNLRYAPPDDAVRTPAAALWLDATIDRARDAQFAEALVENFTAWHERYAATGFENIRAEWLRHAYSLNQPITVTTPTETHDGIFAGIDEHGNLLLTQGAETRKITTADVS